MSSESRVAELEELLRAADGELSASANRAALLAAERDAAARNLLRAEAELSDVSEYSTKMFRQVGDGCSQATPAGEAQAAVACDTNPNHSVMRCYSF